jgi:hypothetical protein
MKLSNRIIYLFARIFAKMEVRYENGDYINPDRVVIEYRFWGKIFRAYFEIWEGGLTDTVCVPPPTSLE